VLIQLRGRLYKPSECVIKEAEAVILFGELNIQLASKSRPPMLSFSGCPVVTCLGRIHPRGERVRRRINGVMFNSGRARASVSR